MICKQNNRDLKFPIIKKSRKECLKLMSSNLIIGGGGSHPVFAILFTQLIRPVGQSAHSVLKQFTTFTNRLLGVKKMLQNNNKLSIFSNMMIHSPISHDLDETDYLIYGYYDTIKAD